MIRSIKTPSTVNAGGVLTSSSGAGKVFQAFSTVTGGGLNRAEEGATEVVITPTSREDVLNNPATVVPSNERRRLQSAQQSGRRKRTMPVNNPFMV